MMNIIVFSKDRALQLELFIRSFKKYVKNSDEYKIKVLYQHSDMNFEFGYSKLYWSRAYSNIEFHKETSFKTDLIRMVDPNEKYTVFFVDDIVFKNPINFYDKQMMIFETDNEILCRSLRLQPGLTFCYTMQVPMKNPNFLDFNTFYWKGEDADYGYPMSLDGHIFRTKEILPYVLDMEYRNPNSFEGGMATNPINLPKMICYDKSIIVNNPCNMVQTNNHNLHGKLSARELNDKFLHDSVIDLEPFDGINNSACHQEIELKYIKWL